jgi:hypothetical protein
MRDTWRREVRGHITVQRRFPAGRWEASGRARNGSRMGCRDGWRNSGGCKRTEGHFVVRTRIAQE